MAPTMTATDHIYAEQLKGLTIFMTINKQPL